MHLCLQARTSDEPQLAPHPRCNENEILKPPNITFHVLPAHACTYEQGVAHVNGQHEVASKDRTCWSADSHPQLLLTFQSI